MIAIVTGAALAYLGQGKHDQIAALIIVGVLGNAQAAGQRDLPPVPGRANVPSPTAPDERSPRTG